MRFYLGVHKPGWLALTDKPLFLSFQSLRARLSLGPGRWAVDSGGFTEIHKHGRWTIPAGEYAEKLQALSEKAGAPDFAAIQDWMCEPSALAATGLGIREHQRRTTDSYLALKDAAPGLPWCPVLQGWRLPDYLAHLAMYRAAGVDLSLCPVVGLGSICRRQATKEARDILEAVADRGVSIHAFGLKEQGLRLSADFLHSADSMAWSLRARKKQEKLPGHEHRNCANCLEYALLWRARMVPDG